MELKLRYLKKGMVLLLATLVFPLHSCTQMKKQTKNQTEELIQLNRGQLNDALQELEEQQVLTKNESAQLREKLNADFDYYLSHQDIGLPELKDLFSKTTEQLSNLRITPAIFIQLSTTYNVIAKQISMRNHPGPINPEDYAIQSAINQEMNEWFAHYQKNNGMAEPPTTQEGEQLSSNKPLPLPTYIKLKADMLGRFKLLLSEEMISSLEYRHYTETITKDIRFCETNTDTAKVKLQLLAGLRQMENAELDTEDREAIVDCYFILSEKHGIDIKKQLNKWLYGSIIP